MRLNVRQSGGIADVAVFLSEQEVSDLVRDLQRRLDREPGYTGPGYHLHLEDGAGSELTIGVIDPE